MQDGSCSGGGAGGACVTGTEEGSGGEVGLLQGTLDGQSKVSEAISNLQTESDKSVSEEGQSCRYKQLHDAEERLLKKQSAPEAKAILSVKAMLLTIMPQNDTARVLFLSNVQRSTQGSLHMIFTNPADHSRNEYVLKASSMMLKASPTGEVVIQDCVALTHSLANPKGIIAIARCIKESIVLDLEKRIRFLPSAAKNQQWQVLRDGKEWSTDYGGAVHCLLAKACTVLLDHELAVQEWRMLSVPNTSDAGKGNQEGLRELLQEPGFLKKIKIELQDHFAVRETADGGLSGASLGGAVPIGSKAAQRQTAIATKCKVLAFPTACFRIAA
jgi:hypothetical protein